MQSVRGLQDIASGFDAFIIDQFGVIHDGAKLYPGALDAMAGLKAAAKKVVILTNSGKRRVANQARIVAMGIPAELFIDVVSSGDVAYRAIASGAHGHPRNACIIGKEGETYDFGGLDLDLVSRPEQADILIVLGSNTPATTLDGYAHLLEPAARLAIPAICCNPDKLMMTSTGLHPAPGAIAALYEELGGKVAWVGKPYQAIYKHALAAAGNPAPVRTLCIGDSLEHDIKGGKKAGLKTCLVRTGIATNTSDQDIAAATPRPDFILQSLRW